MKLLEHLPKKYTCILFDRRECGESGGRVEAIGWGHYVLQGKGLLDHLKIERAHLMGGCMGCSPVMAMAVKHPQAVLSMVLWWPVGGPKYRMKGEQRFAEHLQFVGERGLEDVVQLVQREGKAFGADPRGGPWASVIKRDPEFAAQYAAQPREAYMHTVDDMRRALLDRDTAPGATPEELMPLQIPALIVPGRDESHATSAARYLEECLPKSEYWDVPPDGQTVQNAPERVMKFLDAVNP